MQVLFCVETGAKKNVDTGLIRIRRAGQRHNFHVDSLAAGKALDRRTTFFDMSILVKHCDCHALIRYCVKYRLTSVLHTHIHKYKYGLVCKTLVNNIVNGCENYKNGKNKRYGTTTGRFFPDDCRGTRRSLWAYKIVPYRLY